MPINKPCLACLLLPLLMLAGCAAAGVPMKAVPGAADTDGALIEDPQALAACPVIAHQLRGGDAPIVRWIDTDGDGVSNYRLLCIFEAGRVQVKKVVPDASFRQRFRQARR